MSVTVKQIREMVAKAAKAPQVYKLDVHPDSILGIALKKLRAKGKS